MKPLKQKVEYFQVDETMDFINNSNSSSSSSLPPNSMSILRYPLPQDTQEDKEKLALEQFWYQQFVDIQNINEATQPQLLPVRVKKIMKADQNNKILINSEAPMLLAKACEVLIEELTFRAWIHVEANKKRTLQNSDIFMAIKKDKFLHNFFSTLSNSRHHRPHDFLDSQEVNSFGIPSKSHSTAGFMENGYSMMMNMGEIVLGNQQFAPQNQPETMMQSSYLPSDQSMMMMEDTNVPSDQLYNMMQYYLPSQMMLPQFLPLSNNQLNNNINNERMTYMPYDHHHQFQTMQQPHYLLSNDAFPCNYFQPK